METLVHPRVAPTWSLDGQTPWLYLGAWSCYLAPEGDAEVELGAPACVTRRGGYVVGDPVLVSKPKASRVSS